MTNKKNPYTAGSWVRGQQFFGRKNLIRDILDGDRHYLWVAGTRRFGKTSLLKQLEHLTTVDQYAERYIPLFWDLQGSRNAAGLKEALLESLEDAEERFAEIDIDIDVLEDEPDIFSILRTLRRKAKDNQKDLLLLCDEAEELITVANESPEVLPRLRRFVQRGENIYTVLAATIRLRQLAQATDPNTSPFLSGFIPPTYLNRMADEDAKALIAIGGFDEQTAAQIMQMTNNHPYLNQVVCKRLFEIHDLNRVIDEVCHDDMIGHFFAIDFQYLEPKQSEILLYILQHESLTLEDMRQQFDEPGVDLIKLLYELTQLGLISQDHGPYRISNYFFATWLEREKEKLFTSSTLQRAAISEFDSGFEFDPNLMPKTGDTLGQHDILEKLGSGGMGIVYKAIDRTLNRTVAIKVLLPQFLNDKEFKQRFIREAQSASAMNHPNITTVYQIGEKNQLHYLCMEYIEGKRLKEWRRDLIYDLTAQLDIAVQIAGGLAHAHNKNVIHRDIKSDNIMVTAENQVKIMDFGLSKSLKTAEQELTKTGTTFGTLSYMSPEQASGLPTDHRSDIFSFGVVLYELFSGRLPFTGDFELSVLYAIINEEPSAISDSEICVPEEIEAIVMTALKKDRTERYQSMDELLLELERYSVSSKAVKD